jgi:hypothetical protein
MGDEAKGSVDYEIQVKGVLDSTWSSWFSDLEVVPQCSGETRIRGPIADQAALHGVLDRIFDLGLALLSVQRVASMARTGTEVEHDE